MEHARGRGCQGRETNEPDSLRGNISPLGRDASLWSSVAIIWFNVWTRLVLYILKRSPYFWRGRGRANFHHKDTRTVNIDLPDKWRTSCHKPLERLLSTAAFPFVGTECQVVSCAISCRSQILKRNKFRWTKKHLSLFCNPLPSQVMLILGLCTLPAPVLFNCLSAKPVVVFLSWLEDPF